MKRLSFKTSKGIIISCFSDVIRALYFDNNKYYVRVDKNNEYVDYEIDSKTYDKLFISKEVEGLMSFAN